MSIYLYFLFISLLVLIIFKKLLPSKRKLPPGPTGLPIIGNLHQIGGLLHSTLHKLSLEHGPVMLLRFGVVPMVVFSSKETAKEALKTHDLETCNRPKLVGNGLFTHNFKDIGFTHMIKINTYAIGRDPKCWTKAEEFIPERFSDTSINFKGQHFELLPFGAGRRSCPGMALGMANLELGLLNLLYFFDWSLPNGMAIEDIDMDEAGDLNIAKKVPLELVPTLHHW
ncbi:hypothetical protein BRARA_I03622 [Brassica rapa]|uniref:Cytochrome P450 n=1 Tax=Brassica campestris TaxID=3711 RepID=A0A397Y2I2_BRACM|nr:hypothetical protein BRARA_I03622 [Brassica rapa]